MSTQFNFEDNKNTSGQSQSQFNSGVAKLMRIDRARRTAQEAKINFSPDVWFNCLLSIRSELNYKLTEEERREADKFQKECRQFKSMDQHTFKQTQPSQRYNFHEGKLQEYELWLGDKEFKYGLGMPDKPEESSGMEI